MFEEKDVQQVTPGRLPEDQFVMVASFQVIAPRCFSILENLGSSSRDAEKKEMQPYATSKICHYFPLLESECESLLCQRLLATFI